MPRKYKLTWQPGTRSRAGRWRKKYKGKPYYFSGGSGKSDRDAYSKAVAEWETLKQRIDAAMPKPHQADYERAIREWDVVLAWCRKHNETAMADTAIAKQATLRRRLSAPKPCPVESKYTFDGQFDRSVRHPELDEAIKEIGAAFVHAAESCEPGLGLPGYEQFATAMKRFVNGAADSDLVAEVIVPRDAQFDSPDPLRIECEVWNDRLEVMERSSAPTNKTLQSYVEKFVADKVESDEVSATRVYKLRLHLNHFMDWLGRNTPVVEINGEVLSNFRIEVLRKCKADGEKWSRTTAHDCLGSIKTFVRWLWHIEAIASLPRNMDGKNNVLNIGKPSPEIVVFEKHEIAKLLNEASERTELYILLMLNCGMTQKDVADLDMSEVDWTSGRITRKRSKTREHESVPEVCYQLWPETLRLLRQERNPALGGRVLLNAKGHPLWYEEIGTTGKLRKNDNVRNAFNRLREKTGIDKPLKSLKKTSATLIRNHRDYASLERLFLGHAPQSMSDRHYTLPPQTLLDEAIMWLGKEFGIVEQSLIVDSPKP